MNGFLSALRCIDCGTTYPLEHPQSLCPDCSPQALGMGLLDPVYDLATISRSLTREVLSQRPPSLWKYRELLPVRDSWEVVTLGEGGTPLIHCRRLGQQVGIENLFVKNETLNPTFSFKDRVFTVIITRAKAQGANTVASVSDGNAGSAAAAYAAKAGIPCIVFAPTFSVKTKVTQMSMYGARVFSVRGSLIQAGMLLMEACANYGWHNITTAKLLNPYVTEGHKTIAYEICEQLQWRAPHWSISPVSSGDNLGAIWKGYREFHEMGLISNLPRMVGVQGEGADPLVRVIHRDIPFHALEPFEARTIADALCIDSVLGNWAIQAVKESSGEALSVTDEQILQAQSLLARTEGLFVEPSSAATLAAAIKLRKLGAIHAQETVVCIATGSGLKVMEAAESRCPKPVEIDPVMEDLSRHLS